MPKQKALKEEDEELYELSENLRLQLVVLELQKKLNKYRYRKDNETTNKRYTILRIAKLTIINIYSILVIFEKPLHCYKSTTFYTNENKPDNQCDPNLQYLNINFFMNEKIYRYIELVFLVTFIFLKFAHYNIKNRSLFQKVDKYLILQYIVLCIIGLCIVDITISIYFESFPLINFFLRGILIILLIKSQRSMWEIVLKIFYQTRVLTFLIFCVMVFFGIVGYFLFSEKSADFDTIPQATYSLFILLSTCNFPDVMLGTFDDNNKLPFFYFLLYLAINYFILFTLLKTLYYSEFFDSFKANARKAIESVFDQFHNPKNIDRMTKTSEKKRNNSNNSNFTNISSKTGSNNYALEGVTYNEEFGKSILIPEHSRRFNKVLFKLNKQFYLTKNDYIKIFKLIGYKGDISDFTKNDIYQILNENDMDKRKTRDFIKNHSTLLKFFSNKYTEIVINIIDFIIMMLLLIEFDDNMVNYFFILIPQVTWCLFFIFEFIVYKEHFSFQYLLTNEFILLLFFLINCIILTALLFIFIFYKMEENAIAGYFLNIVKVLISLRMVRVFLLFKKYNTFETFSRTFHNMKNIFYGLFSALFSFFYIFITMTMFLTGGNICVDSFDNNEAIPSTYANINFNDFGSGFLSCFCLTMINNINIISKSLSFGHSPYFQGYFALFYFISTLVILNISTTLLLEMYMSIQSKMKEVQNKVDETDDEEISMKEIME
jgi:hypothetical protein